MIAVSLEFEFLVHTHFKENRGDQRRLSSMRPAMFFFLDRLIVCVAKTCRRPAQPTTLVRLMD